MLRAIYPGSFDPVTNGHLDIIKRASRIADELIIGVLKNKTKSSLFSMEERVTMLEQVVAGYGNVSVMSFEGLLAGFARRLDAGVVIRGLRAAGDFTYECRMSQANSALYPGLETLFLPAAPEYSHISSSMVKEIASYGGDTGLFVPQTVALQLKQKFAGRDLVS